MMTLFGLLWFYFWFDHIFNEFELELSLTFIFSSLRYLLFFMFTFDSFDTVIISARKNFALFVLISLKLIIFELQGIPGASSLSYFSFLYSKWCRHSCRLVSLGVRILEPSLIASNKLDVFLFLSLQLLIIINELLVIFALLFFFRKIYKLV